MELFVCCYYLLLFTVFRDCDHLFEPVLLNFHRFRTSNTRSHLCCKKLPQRDHADPGRGGWCLSLTDTVDVIRTENQPLISLMYDCNGDQSVL